MNRWGWARTVLCIVAGTYGLVRSFSDRPGILTAYPFPWWLVQLAVGVVVMPVMLTLYMWPYRWWFPNKRWTWPHWDSRLLLRDNPLLFFHVAGCCGLAGGAGACLGALFVGVGPLVEGFSAICVGIAVLFSIKRYTKTHRPVQAREEPEPMIGDDSEAAVPPQKCSPGSNGGDEEQS